MNALTFISLFAGFGGIDLGLERAGMRCVAQVEIDDYATRVLAKHWPTVPRFKDVRGVGAHNLPSADVIAGGFPCQPHSLAGDAPRAGRSRVCGGAGRDCKRGGVMQAYKVYVRGDADNCAYIYAETRGKAKARALRTTSGRVYTELGAQREPVLDDPHAQPGPATSAERLDGYDCEYWGRAVRF